MAPPNIKISIYDYEYSLSGNTLDLTGYEHYAGRYTLMDFSGPPAPGGNIVPPSGMGWFREGRQEIYNTNGFYNSYGISGGAWGYINWGSYTANQSTGRLTRNTAGGRDAIYLYSVTDFSGGNKTLRIWIEGKLNEDQVYRLQAYPSGTQLPRTR